MSWDRPFQFFTNVSYNHPKQWGLSGRVEFKSGRRYTRSIQDTILYQNDIPYYDGPREDDRPYAYISKLVEKNIELKVFKMIKLNNYKLKKIYNADSVFTTGTAAEIQIIDKIKNKKLKLGSTFNSSNNFSLAIEGKAKIELAVAKGKKKFDKRAAKKNRDWNRDKARYIRKSS